MDTKTLAPEVIEKLAKIGSQIISQPVECNCRKEKEGVALAQWFWIADKESGAKRYYIVTHAEQRRYITQSMADAMSGYGDERSYHGFLGWNQPYIRCEISKPTTA